MAQVKKSFFEYLGIADVERVHSQFFAWLFSSDCMALGETQKERLIKDVFGLKKVSKIKNIHTEIGNIDILIQTENEIMVIENKIKSSLHSDQLQKYEKYCSEKEEYKQLKRHFYVLSLIDENPSNKNWVNISYTHIYNCLKQIAFIPQNNHSVIIEEYLIFLKKLTMVLVDFTENTTKYDMVFLNGGTKKSDKITYKLANEQFIADNQLETILQKAFLISLTAKIKIGNVGETRGDALVNFPISKEVIKFQKREYKTIVQLQKHTIKFVIATNGDYSKSKKEWVEDIIPKMEKLMKNNTFEYKKLNRPETKAYISISKTLKKKYGKEYWEMSSDELIEFIQSEIGNGKKLTEELVELLKI